MTSDGVDVMSEDVGVGGAACAVLSVGLGSGFCLGLTNRLRLICRNIAICRSRRVRGDVVGVGSSGGDTVLVDAGGGVVVDSGVGITFAGGGGSRRRRLTGLFMRLRWC